MATDDNIFELGPHGNMSATEALQLTLREEPSEVIILQVCGCGCGGVCIKSSGITRAETVFILEKAKLFALGYDHASLGCCADPEDDIE